MKAKRLPSVLRNLDQSCPRSQPPILSKRSTLPPSKTVVAPLEMHPYICRYFLMDASLFPPFESTLTRSNGRLGSTTTLFSKRYIPALFISSGGINQRLVLEWWSILTNNRGGEEAVGGKKEWLAVNIKGRGVVGFSMLYGRINI